MEKKKSVMFSQVGAAYEIMRLVWNAVQSLGGGDINFRQILRVEGLAQKIAEVIMATPFKVIVNYDMSLEKMVWAGKYNSKDIEHLTPRRFPLKGKGRQAVELFLVYVKREEKGGVLTREVLEEMARQGLEPAKIEHLLALGKTFPELQRELLVIVLGSPGQSQKTHYHPKLGGDDNRRYFTINTRSTDYAEDRENGWSDICRFLAIRKAD